MTGASVALLRAICGPLLLITLGTLFAIDHFGPYPFWRTWPVLLIVYGILKLLEYTVPGPGGYHPGSPTGGRV